MWGTRQVLTGVKEEPCIPRFCVNEPQRRLRVGNELSIPLGEITIRTSRSSGPGGQHANVTASRVEAIFDVGASASLEEDQRARILARAGPRVVAVAQDARSQARNRELALERLARRLEAGPRGPPRSHATKPTTASRRRRLADKRRARSESSSAGPRPRGETKARPAGRALWNDDRERDRVARHWALFAKLEGFDLKFAGAAGCERSRPPRDRTRFAIRGLRGDDRCHFVRGDRRCRRRQ